MIGLRFDESRGARDVIDFGAIPDTEAGNRHIAERLARCVR